MPLIEIGRFFLSSGLESDFLIDCNALSDKDMQGIAYLLNSKLQAQNLEFGNVVGVPRGGHRLAAEMKQYIKPGAKSVLLCEDVFTTGKSLQEFRDLVIPTSICIAIFARTPAPDWLTVLFQM